MKTLTTLLAGTGLLLAGGTAFAQEPVDPYAAAPVTAEPATAPTDPMADDTMEPADTTVPGSTQPAVPMANDTTADDMMADEPMMDEPMPADRALTAEAEAATAFSDAEIASFAAAAVQIQALEGDEASKQQQAAAIVARSGIDAATFNTIGEAMRTDPALAERVGVAAAAIQGQPEG